MSDYNDPYISMAYINAFGQRDEAQWDASAGYAANRARILRLYDYYARVATGQPDALLWAGLGRMAGGAVVGGLDFMVATLGESMTTQKMVQIGKDIFTDLAWQHEAWLENPDHCIELAARYDTEHAGEGRRSYADAWRKIRSGGDVAGGNLDFLWNEQWIIIQPRYDEIRAVDNGLFGFQRARAFANNIHPYHRPFIERLPSGDITLAPDRWSWISETDGMWQKWVAIPGTERVRLSQLSLDDDISGRWGPVLNQFLPPGAFDSEDA